jgi:hypothetical protein
MPDSKGDQRLSDKEIDARREAALKKLLATPHKPHKPEQKTRKPAKGGLSKVSRSKLRP